MVVPVIKIFDDQPALVRAAAADFVQVSTDCIRDRGRFRVVLSGGSTPRGLFALLASSPYRTQVNWELVHVFWGDERMVPPEDPDSNYGAAHQDLLRHVEIPADQIHPIRGELEPHLAADQYQAVLSTHFGLSDNDILSTGTWPQFDLVYLGMGADGHTASLFPHTPALVEKERWVVANHIPSMDVWRVTLTAPLINAARRIEFLVSGADKRDALRRVLAGPYDPEKYPAQLIQPVGGSLLWRVDRLARGDLELGQR